MRQGARRDIATRIGARSLIFTSATATVIAPATAFAAGPSTSASYAWVWTTLLAVLVVAAVWLASGTAMRAFIRLRWLPRHRKIQFDRGLNVFFGALLLLALVLPYLAVIAPTMAMLSVGSLVFLSLVMLLFRRSDSDSDDIRLQE
ncbi:MAG: hypothetical protein ACQEVA_03180 [Myxococcota bacterium]